MSETPSYRFVFCQAGEMTQEVIMQAEMGSDSGKFYNTIQYKK
jgi:hypothetical protein